MFAPGFNSPTRFEADVYDCEVWGLRLSSASLQLARQRYSA